MQDIQGSYSAHAGEDGNYCVHGNGQYRRDHYSHESCKKSYYKRFGVEHPRYILFPGADCPQVFLWYAR